MKAERIRLLRRRLGLTQAAFANELGVTQATISKWELGLAEPGGSARQLLRLIAANK